LISREEFLELAKTYRVIPVIESVFSGTETPLSIFEKLASTKPGSFLLESAEQGVWSRFSFVGVENLGFLTSWGKSLTWKSASSADALPFALPDFSSLTGLEALELMQKSWNAAPINGLPPLVSGLVGMLGWDTIHQIETLGSAKTKEVSVPDLAMAVIRDLVVLDHQDSSLKLVSNVYLGEESDSLAEYESALSRIGKMKEGLLSTTKPFIAKIDFDQEPDIV
jgi:anthranilate synthase component 1